MKLTTVLLSLCFLLAAGRGYSQFDEAGTFMGVANYSGDLTERHIEPLELNLSVGIYARRQLDERLALKASLQRILLTGSDANGSLEKDHWQRNLQFSTELYELGANIEYDLFQVKSAPSTLSPYVFAGLAAIYFNPQTEMGGQTYDLHAYRTEGVEYSQFQVAIPFGAGFKLRFNDRGTMGLECGLRKTFTDYIDDVSGAYPMNIQDLAELNSPTFLLSYRTPEVLSDAPELPTPGSQRGNSKRKDWYQLFGLTLGIRIGK